MQPQRIPLIVLIGLPGSGKSTLASFLWERSTAIGAERSPLNPPQVGDFESLGWLGLEGASRLISTDAIRAQLFGDEAIQGSWLKVWLEVRRQFQTAVSLIAAGELEFAIYDATNAVRKQRRQAIALARKTGFTHLTGIWMNVPVEICLERNQQRSRQVPEAVILSMARRLYGAPPALEEGFDRLIEYPN